MKQGMERVKNATQSSTVRRILTSNEVQEMFERLGCKTRPIVEKENV